MMYTVKLTRTEIDHILEHLYKNSIDAEQYYEDAWYVGRKDHFLKRHASVKNKLENAVSGKDEK